MPIRPENKARYPRNWPTISGEVRERADWRCQWVDGEIRCAAQQYAVGEWFVDGGIWQFRSYANTSPAGARWTYEEARQFAAETYWNAGECGKPPTVIVLTVAHLDHQPENCDPSNLRAWCQRHHLAYDAEHHAASRAKNRDAATGQLQLLEQP